MEKKLILDVDKKEEMNGEFDYIDADGKTHPHIRLVKKETKHKLVGWYFISETYDWYGPYLTIEECKILFKGYCAMYLA